MYFVIVVFVYISSIEVQVHVRMCDGCLAMKGKHVSDGMNYRNFGDDAVWKHTFLDHRSYLSRTRRGHGEISPWNEVEGFRIETVSWDFLHNIYLGVARDLVASGIWLFIYQGMYDHYNLDGMDDLLGQIQMDISTMCKANKFFCN